MKSVSRTAKPPILVVDDEEMVLTVLRETLQQAHYDVVTSGDPREALEELRKQEFSVIITDQRMPGLSGLQLLAQARELRPNMTRILITAVLNLDTVIDAINKGEIFRFIVKPWLREEFLATVQNGVQRYELLCHNAHLQEATRAMNQEFAEVNDSLKKQLKFVGQQNQQLTEMNQVLEGNYSRSLDLSAGILLTFYPDLGHQARRVTELCRAMADLLELSSEDRRILESSGRLHDIGFIGVPRQIIRRWQESTESLEAAERALVEQHPILGQELASRASGLDKLGEVIRAHHERWDGTGYPDQLRGEKIPRLARLLAVAVAYASSRLPPAERLEEIKMAAGSAFDPEAVSVLFRALPLVPPSPAKEPNVRRHRAQALLLQQ
jgi:response regulator RpfG family c-di-GMP phosphodiesterase